MRRTPVACLAPALWAADDKPAPDGEVLDVTLRTRHADGETTPIWSGSKGTKTAEGAAGDLFRDVKVRTVDVKDVGK